MSKFKVGDKIVRLTDGSSGNYVTKGNVYVVIDCNGSNVRIKDDNGVAGVFHTPYFELCKELPVTELTSLPPKWCIKFSSDEINKAINKHFRQCLFWENDGCYTAFYWRSDNIYTQDVTDYTEITFDQFKKWVLGNPRKEDLLAEAKKRFPLGTTFYPVSASTATVSKEVGTGTVKSELDIKWLGEEIINGSNGYLYSRGTWAEIVSCNTVAPTPDKIVSDMTLRVIISYSVL